MRAVLPPPPGEHGLDAGCFSGGGKAPGDALRVKPLEDERRRRSAVLDEMDIARFALAVGLRYAHPHGERVGERGGGLDITPLKRGRFRAARGPLRRQP